MSELLKTQNYKQIKIKNSKLEMVTTARCNQGTTLLFKGFGNGKFFFSVLCLPGPHLFDQIYSKNSYIVNMIKSKKKKKVFYLNIF